MLRTHALLTLTFLALSLSRCTTVPALPEYRPPQPPLPTEASGRFRISLIGFKCHTPTQDDILQSDGVDDEVYLAPVVIPVKITDRVRFGYEVVPEGVIKNVRTVIMGDTNHHPERLRAGSGHNLFGGNGGFKEGDPFPNGQMRWPEGALIRPAAQNEQLPMLLFEGELVNKTYGVVVMPTIWEHDKSFAQFSNFVTHEMINELAYAASAPIGGWLFIDRELGFKDVDVDNGVDRPIGVSRLAERDGYVFYNSYDADFVVMTYTEAEAIAMRGNDSMRGVKEIRYRDDDLGGDYSVYLRVEKL